MPAFTHWLKTTLSERLPSPVKVGLRRLAFAGLRLAEWVRPQSDLYPPAWMPLVGSGDFRAVGQAFFRYFTTLAHLQPHHAVLDVGCGLGRMAVPLTTYLQAPQGRYLGFDIEREAIAWCQRNITRRFPNFEFVTVAAHNPNYLSSAAAATPVRFPAPTAGFDFVIVTSVFTHLLPADVETYINEIARVLRPSGQCLMTFFLLNPESEALLDAGQSHFPLSHRWGLCRVANPQLPQAAIAYPETQVLSWLKRAGLQASIHYGNWCGRTQFMDGQDILVVSRAG